MAVDPEPDQGEPTDQPDDRERERGAPRALSEHQLVQHVEDPEPDHQAGHRARGIAQLPVVVGDGSLPDRAQQRDHADGVREVSYDGHEAQRSEPVDRRLEVVDSRERPRA